MGATFRFLAEPSETSEVIEWFRALSPPPHEIDGDGSVWLHFSEQGPLLEPDQSPLVTIYLPRVRRRALWTVGEVHFMPKRGQFPALDKVSAAFRMWLARRECVYSNEPGFEGSLDYYLEGSVKNSDAAIYAFESGLRECQYFVAENDTPHRLDDLCAALRLRGIDC